VWRAIRSWEVIAMGIVSWVVVGLVAGWLAGKVMGGRGFGCIGNVVVGIVGALLGGWLASRFLDLDVTGINPTSIIIAVIGAVIFLAILRLIPGRQPFER
jgi:uncharacterized membrane protein YeaQ/YmgE (transglycosylase-associated protein family)